MKVRKGFVSNSSSSSFIIKNGDVNEVANSMFNTISRDFMEWDDVATEDSKYIEKLVRYRRNLNKAIACMEKDECIGVTMPSCNEDTYIAKDKGTIYITTSNNHAWEIGAQDCEYIPEKNEIAQDVINDKMFIDVRNGDIHSCDKFTEWTDKKTCDKCKAQTDYYCLTPAGKVICNSCVGEEPKGPLLNSDVCGYLFETMSEDNPFVFVIADNTARAIDKMDKLGFDNCELHIGNSISIAE